MSPILCATRPATLRAELPQLPSGEVMRHLAAILIADVVEYSRLMERDEQRTHARLRTLQSEILNPAIARHAGRVVRMAGDGMLVVFPSATEALRCAVEAQRRINDRGQSDPPEERIRLRMGLNVADVLIDGKDIAGSGVNLAARLEALAEPGGICVSQALREQIHEDIGVAYVDAGVRRVKNMTRPVRVFRIACGLQPMSAHLRVRLGRVAAWIHWPSASYGALAALGIVLSSLPWVRSEPATPASFITTLAARPHASARPTAAAAAGHAAIDVSLMPSRLGDCIDAGPAGPIAKTIYSAGTRSLSARAPYRQNAAAIGDACEVTLEVASSMD
jgi:class 3 adenylate cyclase